METKTTEQLLEEHALMRDYIIRFTKKATPTHRVAAFKRYDAIAAELAARGVEVTK